jgi:hypothetical protein
MRIQDCSLDPDSTGTSWLSDMIEMVSALLHEHLVLPPTVATVQFRAG